jgi:hypothetical protein
MGVIWLILHLWGKGNANIKTAVAKLLEENAALRARNESLEGEADAKRAALDAEIQRGKAMARRCQEEIEKLRQQYADYLRMHGIQVS